MSQTTKYHPLAAADDDDTAALAPPPYHGPDEAAAPPTPTQPLEVMDEATRQREWQHFLAFRAWQQANPGLGVEPALTVEEEEAAEAAKKALERRGRWIGGAFCAVWVVYGVGMLVWISSRS
ncbi:hypothetical protein BU16DRAFT_522324 [Lophium mytilinum]|uniref:Uncharacterized protein n=1 Tax=Lophium mytilinum TaxID=390894 RepID=A0A6A6R9B9_9PEZI|nr:hypothetical protein BU16DRAFT_522324 [Lophium mytilinum]